MQRRFAIGRMLKARRNKNVLSFDLKVFRQLQNWISGGRLFHTTEAHTLKERLAHTVLVLGTAIRERVDDLSDILDAVTRLVRRCYRESHVERKNGQLVSHPCSTGGQRSDRRRGSAWVRLGCCSTTRANEFCRRCSLVIDDVDAPCKIELQ